MPTHSLTRLIADAAQATAKPRAKAKRQPLTPNRCPWCQSRTQVDDLDRFFWVSCLRDKGPCAASGPARKSKPAAIKEWNRVATKP